MRVNYYSVDESVGDEPGHLDINEPVVRGVDADDEQFPVATVCREGPQLFNDQFQLGSNVGREGDSPGVEVRMKIDHGVGSFVRTVELIPLHLSRLGAGSHSTCVNDWLH